MQSNNLLYGLYKKLIGLYPKEFKDQFAESMEQTFQDLWNEKRGTKKEVFSFVLWTFTETAAGIFREHLLLIFHGDPMQTTLKTFGASALISFLLTLPLIVMEIFNRRNFNEEFPYTLFFGLWLNILAISLIFLPIVLSKWTGKHEITNPKPTLIIGFTLILFVVIPSLLSERLFNGTNTEFVSVFGLQVPSQLIAFVIFSLPVMAGIIASRPIVSTLRSGGSLFAHPIHLTIVVVILFVFTAGVVGLITDQWSCFMGVPNCD